MVYAHLFTMRKPSVVNHTPIRNAVPLSLSEDIFVTVYVAASTTLACVFREDLDYILSFGIVHRQWLTANPIN